MKEAEAYAEQFQSSGNSDQNSCKASQTKLLTGSGSGGAVLQRRKEKYKVTSTDQQNITQDIPKNKTPKDPKNSKKYLRQEQSVTV